MIAAETLKYWYEAVNSEIGRAHIVLEGSRDLFKAKLYQARRDANDPLLEGLSLVDHPSNPNEVWIVKRDAAND